MIHNSTDVLGTVTQIYAVLLNSNTRGKECHAKFNKMDHRDRETIG